MSYFGGVGMQRKSSRYWSDSFNEGICCSVQRPSSWSLPSTLKLGTSLQCKWICKLYNWAVKLMWASQPYKNVTWSWLPPNVPLQCEVCSLEAILLFGAPLPPTHVPIQTRIHLLPFTCLRLENSLNSQTQSKN